MLKGFPTISVSLYYDIF